MRSCISGFVILLLGAAIGIPAGVWSYPDGDPVKAFDETVDAQTDLSAARLVLNVEVKKTWVWRKLRYEREYLQVVLVRIVFNKRRQIQHHIYVSIMTSDGNDIPLESPLGFTMTSLNEQQIFRHREEVRLSPVSDMRAVGATNTSFRRMGNSPVLKLTIDVRPTLDTNPSGATEAYFTQAQIRQIRRFAELENDLDPPAFGEELPGNVI